MTCEAFSVGCFWQAQRLARIVASASQIGKPKTPAGSDLTLAHLLKRYRHQEVCYFRSGWADCLAAHGRWSIAELLPPSHLPQQQMVLETPSNAAPSRRHVELDPRN